MLNVIMLSVSMMIVVMLRVNILGAVLSAEMMYVIYSDFHVQSLIC
jgi:hypothetical protein